MNQHNSYLPQVQSGGGTAGDGSGKRGGGGGANKKGKKGGKGAKKGKGGGGGGKGGTGKKESPTAGLLELRRAPGSPAVLVGRYAFLRLPWSRQTYSSMSHGWWSFCDVYLDERYPGCLTFTTTAVPFVYSPWGREGGRFLSSLPIYVVFFFCMPPIPYSHFFHIRWHQANGRFTTSPFHFACFVTLQEQSAERADNVFVGEGSRAVVACKRGCWGARAAEAGAWPGRGGGRPRVRRRCGSLLLQRSTGVWEWQAGDLYAGLFVDAACVLRVFKRRTC